MVAVANIHRSVASSDSSLCSRASQDLVDRLEGIATTVLCWVVGFFNEFVVLAVSVHWSLGSL